MSNEQKDSNEKRICCQCRRFVALGPSLGKCTAKFPLPVKRAIERSLCYDYDPSGILIYSLCDAEQCECFS